MERMLLAVSSVEASARWMAAQGSGVAWRNAQIE
jgi:hypothetical protein